MSTAAERQFELDPPSAERDWQLRQCAGRLVAVALTLTVLGLVLVFSATAVKDASRGLPLWRFFKQGQFALIGVGALAFFSWFDLRRWRALAVPGYLGLLALLVAVLIPGVGTRVNGAARWLRFGGFNMQPSELGKIGLVFVLAAALARFPGKLPFWRGLLPAAGLTGVVVGLIMVEPDFGTAALVAAVAGGVIFSAGARLWQVAGGIVLIAPVGFYIGMTKFNHIINRVEAWRAGDTSGAGYQVWMSKVALGSGGVWGEGLGQGAAKLGYLPEAQTDFILAVAGQELGLAGTLLLLGLFLIFIFEGWRLARLLPDKFGALLALGITLNIGLQAAFNIAVVTGAIPPKGISLPFVSFGGSGLCLALGSVGILCGLARHAPLALAAAGQRPPALLGNPHQNISAAAGAA